MNPEAVIETRGLTKVYDTGKVQAHALRGIDLVVQRGEFVAIMGPSGSGKSTLMNILGCLDRPSSGVYILDGEDVSRLDRGRLAGVRNRRIGFVFQSYNLLPRLTATKNVMMPLLYSNHQVLSDEECQRRALAALAAVGLADRADHRPNTEREGGIRHPGGCVGDGDHLRLHGGARLSRGPGAVHHRSGQRSRQQGGCVGF